MIGKAIYQFFIYPTRSKRFRGVGGAKDSGNSLLLNPTETLATQAIFYSSVLLPVLIMNFVIALSK